MTKTALGNGITIDIKLDPIVRTWLMAKNESREIVKFRDGDPLIKIIHMLLSKRQRRSRKIVRPEESVRFYVPQCRTKNVFSCHHLSEENQKMVNDYLRDAFRTEFYKHVIDKIEEGYQQRQAIVDWMEVCRIQDDRINYEMLKKSWDRSQEKANYYKNARNKTHILLYLVPVSIDYVICFYNNSVTECPSMISL